jgi:hypothetical protein
MADSTGFIPVQRRSNRISPSRIVPVLQPVPTTLITQPSLDPNQLIETVRAAIITTAPNHSIPRTERTEFHIDSALYDVCAILFLHSPNLAIMSSTIQLPKMTSISGYPKDDTAFKEFFHIDNNRHSNGGQTFFVYFSIQSTATEGITNITATNPTAQLLKENYVCFQNLHHHCSRNHFHADTSITQLNHLKTAWYTALSPQMADSDDKGNTNDIINDITHNKLVPYFSTISHTTHYITYIQPNNNRVLIDTKQYRYDYTIYDITLGQAKFSSWILQQARHIWGERNNKIHQPNGTTPLQEQETRAQITKL